MPASGTPTLCSPRQGTFMPLCLSFPREETQCTTHGVLPAKIFWFAIPVKAAVQSPAIQGPSQHTFKQEPSAKSLGQHFWGKWGHLWHKTGVELHRTCTPGNQAAPAADAAPAASHTSPSGPPNHRAPPNNGCCFRHPSRA